MSQLRCKPGDLAFVVKAPNTPEIAGRIVNVIRQYRAKEKIGGFTWLVNPPGWVVSAFGGGQIEARLNDGVLASLDERVIADLCLRPIRPNDGEDESLSWSKPLRREELA